MVGGEPHGVCLLPLPHGDEELVGLGLLGVGGNTNELLVRPLEGQREEKHIQLNRYITW